MAPSLTCGWAIGAGGRTHNEHIRFCGGVMSRYKANERAGTAIAIGAATANAGAHTRQAENEKDDKKDQTADADLLPHGPLRGSAHTGHRSVRCLRWWGRLGRCVRSGTECRAAVATESCIVSVYEATVRTGHVWSRDSFTSLEATCSLTADFYAPKGLPPGGRQVPSAVP